MADLITYYRVSTERQGKSGLGLAAQKTAAEAYAKSIEGHIICSYTEVESGKVKERPELQKAITHAIRVKATLVVAKIDRLTRNLHFLTAIMDSGVNFVACDNPNATRLVIQILASVAENEGIAISQRTKESLKEARDSGKLLGSARPGHWQGREHLRLAGLHKATIAAKIAKRKRRNQMYSDVAPVIIKLRADGLTFQKIADNLNSRVTPSKTTRLWSAQDVYRVFGYAKSEGSTLLSCEH